LTGDIVDMIEDETELLPLFVDLDGTLISTDLLHECFFGAVRRNPAVLFQIPGWLLAGRSRLKLELARRGAPDIAALPYRLPVIEFLRKEKLVGRPLILATAATRSLAMSVAEHLQLFEDVLASDERHNLKSAAKLAAIRQFCATRGFAKFSYMGDSRADLTIWREAAECLAVAPGASVRRALQRINVPVHELELQQPFFKAMPSALETASSP